MNAISIRSAVCTGVLASTTVLMSTALLGQSAKSVITLDPQPARTAASAPLLKGEPSFANLPANFHSFPSARIGQDTYPERLTLRFSASTKITRVQSTKDFQIEDSSSCAEGKFYSAGETCLLLVHFTPKGAGRRLGKITISHTASAETFNVGLVGYGYAPVISFTPAQISTVPASKSGSGGAINGATNMAIDGGDILYIADTGNNAVKKMDSTGAIVTTANAPIATPASIAVDSFGILYTSNVPGSTYYFSVYYPWGSETAYGYAHAAGTCTPSTPCPFSTVGMSSPANMSIDNNDNLFFEEGTEGAAEMPVAGISGGSGAFNLWYLSDQFAYSSGSPASFASDAYGNIYTKYSFTSTGVCYLLEEPLYNAEYAPTANRVAGGVQCGFSGDGGQARSAEISSTIGQIAFDIAGNLYFADAGNQRVRRIDYTTGIINTIAGTGVAGYTGDGSQATFAHLSSPTGVAVDSQGQVYILSSATTGQVIRKLGPNGFLQFGSQTDATTSSAHVVTVSNTGNSSMTLTKEVITGTNAGDFSIDPNTTNCTLAAGMVLINGQSCKIGILFKPGATGARSASLVLIDNTVNGSNTVQLAGTGAVAAAVIAITSPAASASPISLGAQMKFSAHVTSAHGTPTGTVKFAVDGKQVGSLVTLSSGTATVTVKETTAGTHTLSATYSGDKTHAAAGPVKRTFTVAN